jgi:pyridoxamine-phosphate oxidase
MNRDTLSKERKDYLFGTLLETETPENPFKLFEEWMNAALEAKLEDATAMALATSINNIPSCRIVLLKGLPEHGFIFYSNYHSRKGQELESNPNAAATFFWPKLERQVRIQGLVEKTSREASEKYFRTRPLESQISAAASPQSQPLTSRAALERLWKDKIDELGGAPPTIPNNWGGYTLLPASIEFWQGGAGRLHDRILYTRTESGWAKTRLAP